MNEKDTRLVIGNLRWTWAGTVYADFLLSGMPYGLGSREQRESAEVAHALLFRALQGQSLLLGLIAQEDPAAIVERMLEGVDLESCPSWREEAAATLDSLDQIRPAQRVYYLSVPLNPRDLRSMAATQAGALLARVNNALSMPWVMPSEREIAAYQRQSERLLDAIPAEFAARPATAAQMVWQWGHSLTRGLPQASAFPVAGSLEEQIMAPRSGATLHGVDLTLGVSDVAGDKPATAQFVRVAGIDEPTASYQSLWALAELPEEMPVPGSEFLGRIDRFGLPVDWAMRLDITPGVQMQNKNRNAEINLKDQAKQAGIDDTAATWSVENVLSRSANLLQELNVALAKTDEVHIQAMVIFALSAQTASGAVDQGQDLAKLMSGGFKLVARPGLQDLMWWAMQPGTATPAGLREFTQITTSTSLAPAMPLIRHSVGDRNGLVLGVHIPDFPLYPGQMAVTPSQMVLMDVEGASDRQQACSVVTGGLMGNGKTATLMTIAGAVVDRGGQLVITDRTPKGEWARWAGAVTGSQTIDVADPVVSADPLRVLGVREGAAVLHTTMTALLRVPTTQPLGTLLGETLQVDHLAAHQITSTAAWADHLTAQVRAGAGGEYPELERLVTMFRRDPITRVLFDDSLPPLDINAGALVFRTQALPMPSPDEIRIEHLYENLSVDKIFAHAFHALIMWTARHVCFRDSSRLAGYFSSEAWASLSSSQAVAALTEIIRDGRKHRAMVGLDSQNPFADFAAELRKLITWRLIVRCDDLEHAQDCARFILGDGASPQAIDEVADNIRALSPLGAARQAAYERRGEAIVRTPYAADPITRVKILLPASPERARAITEAGNAQARSAA